MMIRTFVSTLLVCALSGGAMAALPATTPGAPDPTFGTGGHTLVNPTATGDDWGGGVLQPDGKLVVTGYVSRTANTFSIAAIRLLDNGALDPSFGASGIAALPIDQDGGADYRGPALDSTGRILIAGYSRPANFNGCTVVAVRPDGTLDASFADAGVFRYQVHPDQHTNCAAVGVQGDDKVVVLGHQNSSPQVAFLLRLTPAGVLDATFAAGGPVSLPVAAGLFWSGLAVGADGSLFVTGNDADRGYAMKFTAAGTVDASFGGAGTFATPFTNMNLATPTALAGGGLLLSGLHGPKHMVLRLTPAGAPDAGFGVNGLAEFSHGFGYSAIGADVQKDGMIVVGLRLKPTTNTWALAAMRLNPNGTADTSYGTNGLAVIASAIDEVNLGMVLAPDGKLWLIGRADVSDADSGLAVARLLGTEITTGVVEFYNTGLDHYFITADPNEAAAIDGGAAGPGWTRTNQTWKSGGPNRVCRFYGSPDIGAATGLRRGPNSHFYTIEAAECAAVKLDPGWRFESYDFNGWPVAGGACPTGTIAVKRVYNNRFAQNDSNHRYMTSDALYNQMTGLGWSGEGTVFCAVL